MDDIPAETQLQSEIAALRYKNERLANELREAEVKLKSKEHTILTQSSENDSLRENLARLNAINTSLQRKLQDVEEKERTLSLVSQKNECEIQKAKHECQHYQDRIVELESQLRSILIDREASDQAKDHAQRNLVDFCRKLASAIECHEEPKPDTLLKKVYDTYQENSRYKLKIATLKQSIESFENENKASSDLINRLNCEKDSLNQQIVSHLTTIDLLKRV
ncbi:unnamed protein product [Allacma fusca]|uniref:Uncharacterized protein n=1 Tax=Allacma fusca TaxID=39272 RepID=A0A8J2JIW0_9HEXA|nr:unnamed protein product [Allacma fusca]